MKIKLTNQVTNLHVFPVCNNDSIFKSKIDEAYMFLYNKLASLEATLVGNYDPLK